MQEASTRKNSTFRWLVLAVATIAVALMIPGAAFAAPVRVMIDPGHGGRDAGAVGGNLMEKQSNLQISREVVNEAKRQGWAVQMTRRGDRFIGLVQRPAKAKAFHADVFVSIHSNSTGRKAMGNMTIYRTPQSRKLGRAIMRELGPTTSYTDIGNRRDVRGLAVLRASKTPAVIVEVLSVTAAKERVRLKNPGERRKLAQAIVRGIASYEGVAYKPLPQPKRSQEPTTRQPAAPKPIPNAPAKAGDVKSVKAQPKRPAVSLRDAVAVPSANDDAKRTDAGNVATSAEPTAVAPTPAQPLVSVLMSLTAEAVAPLGNSVEPTPPAAQQ